MIGFVCVGLQTFINIKNAILFMLFYAVLAYALFVVNHLTFKNATIGMKLMGLIFVDKNNCSPSVGVILRRAILAPAWGIQYLKSIFTGEDITNWELKYFGTIIVLKTDTESHLH